MKRLLALLIPFLTLFAASAPAAQWSSDQYRCVLTLPDGESWQNEIPRRMATGDMIFIANYNRAETVAVVVIPSVTNTDLRNPGAISRILEAVTSLGFSVNDQKLIEDENRPLHLEVIGQRDEGLGDKLNLVARAFARDDVLYIAAAYQRGGTNLATDKRFLRVIDSFQLVNAIVRKKNPAEHPLYPRYQQAVQLSFGAAGAILVLALLVVIFSPRRAA